MSDDKHLDKLDRIEDLLVQLNVVQLYIHGATMNDISKILRVHTSRIVTMLKGVKKTSNK